MQPRKPACDIDPRLELPHLPELNAVHFFDQQPVLAGVVARRRPQSGAVQNLVRETLAAGVVEELRFLGWPEVLAQHGDARAVCVLDLDLIESMARPVRVRPAADLDHAAILSMRLERTTSESRNSSAIARAAWE